ncbi:hypothetical protein OIU85_007878 [Salix viminalis]|uniref:Uncharacterized protein n=1 Tax=Salix viminalis TaxID=40686 RepID=A0A9Q0SNG5_SALVM|nr:hypothetical protein OIU85_007878 [Salix viminalis]
MAQLNGSKVISIRSEQELNDIGDWSNELDHLTLLQRRKLLLSEKPNTTFNVDVIVKKEYEDSKEVSNGIGGQDLGKSGDCSRQGSKVNASVCMDQSQPAEAKVDSSDNNVQITLGDSMTVSAGADLQTIKVKSNSPDHCADDLDHVVLRVRQRMLLSRKMLRLENDKLGGIECGVKFM